MPVCGETLLEAILATRAWELVAVAAAITYLLLAMRQHIACWAFALISTLIYTILYWDVTLYMESLLNAYYLVMAIYGWWSWSHKSEQQQDNIVSWNLKQHGIAIGSVLLLAAVSGYGLHTESDARFPYLDSFTTWWAVLTTYMVAKKVLENWLYWLVINGIGIYLNLDRCLLLTAALLVSYQFISLFGYYSWRKDWHEAQSKAKATASA